jgi:ABC-type Fe3+ transport system permease subunit
LRKWTPWLLVSPLLAFTAVFLLLPMGYLAVMSFTEGASFFARTGYRFTLDNYLRIYAVHRTIVPNTLRMAFWAATLDLLFGVPFAYLLARIFPYRELARALMVFPLFGGLYLAVGIYFLVLPGGLLYPALARFGIEYKDLISMTTVVCGLAVVTFPFMVTNVSAALANIDPQLAEAAESLGASKWQQFWKITLPLARRGIFAGYLMCFGWTFGAFEIPLFFGRVDAHPIMAVQIFYEVFKFSALGYAAALAMVVMLIAYSVTYISLRFARGVLT